MKQLFSVEGTYYKVMTLIANVFILNVLFLLAALTVVGLGPGLIALYRLSDELVAGVEDRLTGRFIALVRANFRRGLQLFGVLVAAVGGPVGLMLLLGSISPVVAPIMLFFVVVALLWSANFTYLFATGDRTLRATADRALYLVIARVPKSIVLLIVPVLALWLVGRVGFFLEVSFGAVLAVMAQQFAVKEFKIDVR